MSNACPPPCVYLTFKTNAEEAVSPNTDLNTFWPQLQPHNLQNLRNWVWQNLSTILVWGGGTGCV